MSDRKEGFYWVKELDDTDWEVGFYLPKFGWQITGSGIAFNDSDFTEIDERPIVREEPKHPNYTGFSGTVDRIPQNE